jgi:hypothetical protein
LDASQEPRTAAEVIDRVQIDWAALEYLVSGLSLDRLETPGPDGWSVKDHLAHMGEWERALVAVLDHRPQHEGFALPADIPDDIDALNGILYQRSRDLSMSEVQANSRRAHAELLSALGKLTDADIHKPVTEFGAAPTDTRRLLDKIAGDTYAHYAEHTGWITTLLDALP